ncbi:MAG: CGNR zinc finger domain-containing protein [Rubrobacter sp.]|nr:CGNR zinc finger domain-containing protein [Rubrobacter sp.]
MDVILSARRSPQTPNQMFGSQPCRNEKCQWVFHDGSKNRSGSWRDMQTCGARNNSRATNSPCQRFSRSFLLAR